MAHKLQCDLNRILNEFGLECHPFKVEWYNQHVNKGFELNYDDDTLAFVVISTPSFFEKKVLPFVLDCSETDSKTDYLDQCVTDCLTSTSQLFGEYDIETMLDFEMRPGTRRPKILVQTAGHVSGAAYFYQKNDIVNPPWPSDQKIFGVSLHPKYVGWFALRGVMIFKNLKVPELIRSPPVDILLDDEKKVKLLNLYNLNWQDWRFRDVVEPIERYSELQKNYFNTPPAERKAFIKSLEHAQ